MRPILFTMVNRSKKCKFCRNETVFPIKYRKKSEKRSWRRAFLVCINCHICTDFLDSNHNSIMPYYDDITVLKIWKLKDKKRILRIVEIKRDKNLPCPNEWKLIKKRNKKIKIFKLRNDQRTHDYVPLWLEYARDKREYVGILCKDCKSFFSIRTLRLNFDTREKEGFEEGYVGHFVTSPGADMGSGDGPETMILTLYPKDMKILKKFLVKNKIKNLRGSSN